MEIVETFNGNNFFQHSTLFRMEEEIRAIICTKRVNDKKTSLIIIKSLVFAINFL